MENIYNVCEYKPPRLQEFMCFFFHTGSEVKYWLSAKWHVVILLSPFCQQRVLKHVRISGQNKTTEIKLLLFCKCWSRAVISWMLRRTDCIRLVMPVIQWVWVSAGLPGPVRNIPYSGVYFVFELCLCTPSYSRSSALPVLWFGTCWHPVCNFLSNQTIICVIPVWSLQPCAAVMSHVTSPVQFLFQCREKRLKH